MHVSNKRYYVSDMVFTAGKIRLKLLDNTGNAVLVKNLYLSCDSYTRNRMSKLVGSCIESMVPGEPISGLGVCKVVDSKYPDLKEGDLVGEMTGWEECSIITEPPSLFKID